MSMPMPMPMPMPVQPNEVTQNVEESKRTATKWCLKRLISLKTAYSSVFPALANIAEVCLSMPVSNAWPERGCSALKRIKTRLRYRLGVDMLQALLMIAINGPQVGIPECKALITAAIEKWQAQKKRRCQREMKGSRCHLPVQLQYHHRYNGCPVISIQVVSIQIEVISIHI